MGIVALALLVAGAREHAALGRGRIDWSGAVLVASATTSLLLGIGGTFPLATLPVAAVLGVAFVAHQRRTPDPLVELQLVGTPVIGIGLGLMFFMGAIGFSAVAYIPPFAQGVLGRSPIETGFALASISIAWLFTSIVAGLYMIPVGLRRAAIAGALLFIAGALLLVSLPPDAPLALLIAGACCIGLAQGATNAPVLVAAQTGVVAQRRGVATSLMNFSRNLGAAVGVAALGAVLNGVVGGSTTELPLLDPSRGPSGPAAESARATGERAHRGVRRDGRPRGVLPGAGPSSPVRASLRRAERTGLREHTCRPG